MKIPVKIAFIVLSMLSAVMPAAAQKAVLSGYVKEASSGEPLIGAVVFTEDLSAGVSTNNYGFYSLQVERKEQVIKFDVFKVFSHKSPCHLRFSASRMTENKADVRIA